MLYRSVNNAMEVYERGGSVTRRPDRCPLIKGNLYPRDVLAKV